MIRAIGRVILERAVVKIGRKLIDHLKPEKTIERIASKITSKDRSAEYGDVIGIRRMQGYSHFGVYLNDNCIIHYASPNGDFFGGNICVHETTLDKFLDGSSSYFKFEFPEIYGKPTVLDIHNGFIDNSPFEAQWVRLIEILKHRKYHLYSPEETVKRARSRLGENKYNLALNNCEHFAIWCKTNISESHQVNEVLDLLPISPL